jgi:hypothetical protein
MWLNFKCNLFDSRYFFEIQDIFYLILIQVNFNLTAEVISMIFNPILIIILSKSLLPPPRALNITFNLNGN